MSQVDESAPAAAASEPVPEDELAVAVKEGSLSAGEVGAASDDDRISIPNDGTEVIIGEIPDIHELSVMRWTARCTIPSHDLLGSFDTRDEAEQAKIEHLASAHTGGPNRS
jgi:hypothetical protein